MQSKNEERAKNLQMISRWQESRLTQKAFCAANNIAYHIFHYWYGVYRSNQKPNGLILTINITAADGNEQITVIGSSGIKVQFPFKDQSVRFIKQLLLP